MTVQSSRQAQKVDDGTPGQFLQLVGPIAQYLRERWILLSVSLVGAIGAVVVPRIFVLADGSPDTSWTPLQIGLGVAAALCISLDKIADIFDKKRSKILLRGSEDAAENAVSDLNTLLSEALNISFLEGASRDRQLETLRRILTMCAAKAIGPGSRASYYPLRRDASGQRILGKPVHTCEYGRHDKPSRPFVEAEDPDHPVWSIMDAPDEEPEVRSHGDEVYGLDWSRKKYVTFLSIPVKIDDVQFGFLSVNCSNHGAIGGAQRATVIAMARTMAIVLGMVEGPRSMTARQVSPQMTVASTSVTTTGNGVKNAPQSSA